MWALPVWATCRLWQWCSHQRYPWPSSGFSWMIVVRRGSFLQVVWLFTFGIDYKTGKITPLASLKRSGVCRCCT
jgi:hypothetical protein